jgi:hypothetical protein
MLPLAAGLPGPFRLLSWFRMAPSPLPDAFCLNSPGAVVALVDWYTLEVCPRCLIHTDGLTAGAISCSTTADTCVLLATAQRMPRKVTYRQLTVPPPKSLEIGDKEC